MTYVIYKQYKNMPLMSVTFLLLKLDIFNDV